MRRRLMKQAISLVCALLLSAGLGLQGYAQTGETMTNRFNVVVVLDASGSMNSTDPAGLRYEAISQFVNLLTKEGNTLGCVVFSNDVSSQKELISADSQTVKNETVETLRAVPAEGWTNTGAALSSAVSMLVNDGDKDLPSVILFLSDGNTELGSEEETDYSLEQKAEAIQTARENDIAIYSICLNANNDADVSEMEQISMATSGVFQEVTEAEDLQEVFNTFYSLIYGTSSINLVDDVFSEEGVLETRFEVPGLGVEEINIIIYGETEAQKLIRPDDVESNATIIQSETFTLIKAADAIPGQWTLISEGVPGDRIKINMVYNTNLMVEVSATPSDNVINPEDPLVISAWLKAADEMATRSDQYTGYELTLTVTDAYGDAVTEVPMEVVGDHAEVTYYFEAGTYYYSVDVKGNYIEKSSESFGPLTVTSAAMSEAERNNTAPTPVDDPVEVDVSIWPFIGGSLEYDLQTLATDAQDASLRYKIVSTSFIEGQDFTLSGDLLRMEQFSLKKGAFTISATDSGGLSCEIELIVKTHNIGVITLVCLGIAAVVAIAVVCIGLWLALKKPFYTNGITCGTVGSIGTTRKPRRGRLKLTAFGLPPIVGLDYSKAYFQATGKSYIYLISKTPVFQGGRPTKKLQINSGVPVVFYAKQGDPQGIEVRHETLVKKRTLGGTGANKTSRYAGTSSRGRVPPRRSVPRR